MIDLSHWSLTENHAQKEAKNNDAINDAKTEDNKIALQNHAQNQTNYANYANYGNLHALDQKNEPRPIAQTTCPKCRQNWRPILVEGSYRKL